MKEKTAAIIVAAGRGSRMGTKIQKQYLKLLGKPILAYTLEAFEKSETDEIILVVGEGEEDYVTREIIRPYGISRVTRVVAGGKERYESVWNGLQAVKEGIFPEEKNECFVLIHDGVRPLINEKVITDNIETVQKYGSAITTAKVKETILVVNEGTSTIDYVPSRNNSRVAKAPQSFWLKDILQAHENALSEGEKNCIDSCTMMQRYGFDLFLIDGPEENIKITTPEDFYTMRAILEAKENAQIYGFTD